MSTPPEDGEQRPWPRPYEGEYAAGPTDNPRERGTWPRSSDGERDSHDGLDARPRRDDPLVPVDFAGWFERMFGVVRRSWLPLLPFVLIAAVPQAVLSRYAGILSNRLPSTGTYSNVQWHDVTRGLQGPLAGWGIATLIVGLLMQCAGVWIVVRHAAGRDVGAGSAVQFAARRSPALLGWTFVAIALIVIGFICLVIPGVYLTFVLLPTLTGVIVIARGSITDCFALVRGRFWATVGRTVLFAVIVGGASLVLDAIVGLVLDQSSWWFAVYRLLVSVPITMLTLGFAVVTYAELRGRRTGDGTEKLADEVSA
ncbi:MAG: hypothetical protein ACR2F6_03870 [Mycobacteriales bacterium]